MSLYNPDCMDALDDGELDARITLHEYRELLTENTQFKMFLSIMDMLGIDLSPVFELMKTGMGELIENAAKTAIKKEEANA